MDNFTETTWLLGGQKKDVRAQGFSFFASWVKEEERAVIRDREGLVVLKSKVEVALEARKQVLKRADEDGGVSYFGVLYWDGGEVRLKVYVRLTEGRKRKDVRGLEKRMDLFDVCGLRLEKIEGGGRGMNRKVVEQNWKGVVESVLADSSLVTEVVGSAGIGVGETELEIVGASRSRKRALGEVGEGDVDLLSEVVSVEDGNSFSVGSVGSGGKRRWRSRQVIQKELEVAQAVRREKELELELKLVDDGLGVGVNECYCGGQSGGSV